MKKLNLTEELIETISSYMNDEIREDIHSKMAPCSFEKFLKAYLEEDESFYNLLKSEFYEVYELVKNGFTNPLIIPGIEFTIDKELGVELVGETKVKIAIEEEEEPWDIIEDDVDDDVLNDIDNTVNEEYLN